MRKTIITLILISLIASIFTGCNMNKIENTNKLVYLKEWVDKNEFIITDNTDFTKPYYRKIGKPATGSVLSNYKYFTGNEDDYFEPYIKTIGEAEVLNLMTESYKIRKDKVYLEKAKLIANNLITKIKEVYIGKSIKAYLIIPEEVYDKNTQSWTEVTGPMYTKDQLRIAYALLNLYEVSKDKKHLTSGLKLLDTQFLVKDTLKKTIMYGTLPYSYDKVKDNNYEIDTIYPLSISKQIQETFTLAYKITKEDKYKKFTFENATWLENSVEALTINKDKPKQMIIFGGYAKKDIADSKESYSLVNKKEDVLQKEWDTENLFNTKDYLETLVALTYINPLKALNYNETVSRLTSGTYAVMDTLNDKGISSLNIFKNEVDMYSTILALEYFINANDKELENRVNGVLKVMRESEKSNTKGGIERYRSRNIINSETTGYFDTVLIKYLKQ